MTQVVSVPRIVVSELTCKGREREGGMKRELSKEFEAETRDVITSSINFETSPERVTDLLNRKKEGAKNRGSGRPLRE